MSSPLLYRKRLINQINNPEHHIIYIYGPAGFGKTILAQHWMDSQDLPTAWIEGFSTTNANELFQDFLKKIYETLPNLKTKLKPLLTLKSVSIENIKALSQILESDKTPFNVVVDNAEEIRREHNDLSVALVGLMPRHIKLVLLTSTSPSTEFMKGAGINRFAVIGAEELRFTKDETKQLVTEVIPNITESEIKEVLDITEGWPTITGVLISLMKANQEFRNQLSNLKLKGKPQLSIEAKRVLSKLTLEQYELLRNLSPLRTFTAEIAHAITKDIDVVRQLSLLSQDSAIVTQVEQVPPKFRIHPIFRDALMDELRRQPSFPAMIEAVVATLLDKEEIRQATSILVEMGETSRLSEILNEPKLMAAIGVSIQDSISRAAVSEIREWVAVSNYLPVIGGLGKAIVNFYAEFLSGNIEQADSQVKILETEIENLASTHPSMSESWKPESLVLKSLVAFARGRIEENWQLATKAFEIKKSIEEDLTRHQMTYLQVALWGAVITDRYERVAKVSQMLEIFSGTHQNAQQNSTYLAMRSLIAAQEGRLIESQNYLITPISSSSHHQVNGFFGPFGSQLARSILLQESGKLKESVELLEKNADEAKAAGNYPIALASLGRAAYLLTLLKNSDQGLFNIESSRKIIEQNSLSAELHEVVDMWEIRVRHMLFDAERVQELIKRITPSYFVRSFQAATSIGTGNFEMVRNMISTFDLEIPRQAITYHLFMAYLLKDSTSAQIKELVKAIEIGSKHGYFHHFLTQRSDIMQHYISIASAIPTAFNERLARAAGEELNKMMIAKNDAGEALTRREADILRHLATGLPLKDIATNLNISKNTIKTHLRNLYRKLGAEDRKDAVEKGKKLLKV